MSKQKVILVVDDSPSNIQTITSLLKSEFKVKAATNGDKALALANISDGRPDLILLDVQMPGMNGYEVCDRLKSNDTTADIPVIFLTSLTEAQDEAEGFRHGAVDYVHKPFNPVVVCARIKTQLALYDARREVDEARHRANSLLETLLPKAAANELREFGTVAPRRYEAVAVLFCDIANFTRYCDAHDPDDVISRLDSLFIRFENIARSHGIEKIKTIGDSFMGCANLLEPHPDAIKAAIACGLEMGEATSAMDIGWEARVGVHAGPVIAGIVGMERYQFDIWGDTVNVAARLSGVGRTCGVAVTESVWNNMSGYFAGETLNSVNIKGKGATTVYQIHRRL